MTNRLSLYLAVLLLSATAQTIHASSIVHAVFFYNPTCRHCYAVVENVLVPLKEAHGNQFEVALVDTRLPNGLEYYNSAVRAYSVSKNRQRVPMFVVGGQAFVGLYEIEDHATESVADCLNSGGQTWLNTPPTPMDLGTLHRLRSFGQIKQAGLWRQLRDHPTENAAAMIVLAALVTGVVFAASKLMRASRSQSDFSFRVDRNIVIHGSTVLFAFIGTTIAGYLSYISATGSDAVCFVSGDCNVVLQSQYSAVFGIPLSWIGLMGNSVILLASVIAVLRQWPAMIGVVFTLSFVGSLVFIYLTFLEPFIIGNVCTWCLASAVTMLVILLASMPTISQLSQAEAV